MEREVRYVINHYDGNIFRVTEDGELVKIPEEDAIKIRHLFPKDGANELSITPS